MTPDPINLNLQGLTPVLPVRSGAGSARAFEQKLLSTGQDVDLETLRTSVEQLVASSLVLPTLATLRESPMSTGPFAPGAAERRFGPLLDQEFADQVTSGANFPLVDAIVSKLARSYGLTSSTTSQTDVVREPLHA
jgi:hypothetical protein